MKPDERSYNAGVICYKKTSTLLKAWCDELIRDYKNCYADQEALDRIIRKDKPLFHELPKRYNARLYDQPEDVAILHYISPKAKLRIVQESLFCFK